MQFNHSKKKLALGESCLGFGSTLSPKNLNIHVQLNAQSFQQPEVEEQVICSDKKTCSKPNSKQVTPTKNTSKQQKKQEKYSTLCQPSISEQEKAQEIKQEMRQANNNQSQIQSNDDSYITPSFQHEEQKIVDFVQLNESYPVEIIQNQQKHCQEQQQSEQLDENYPTDVQISAQTLQNQLVDILAKLKQTVKIGKEDDLDYLVLKKENLKQKNQKVAEYKQEILALLMQSMTVETKLQFIKSMSYSILPQKTKENFDSIRIGLDYFKDNNFGTISKSLNNQMMQESKFDQEKEQSSEMMSHSNGAMVRKRDFKAECKDAIDKTLQKQEYENGPWTQDESKRFFYAVRTYGKDMKAIMNHMETRDRASIGSYCQQIRKKVHKDPTLPYADVAQILESNLNKKTYKK